MYYFSDDRKLFLSAIFILLLISLQAVVAFGEDAKEVQIFEVRKKLQMTSQDPIIRDYYVNAGQAMGLKQGAFVNVFRKVPLADPFKQETQAHVELPVGVMKVIYSDRTMAIGRIQTIRTPKENPVLDGDVFMVGDRIDLGTISFEKSAEAKGESEVKSAGKAPAPEENADVTKKEEPKIEAPAAPDNNSKKQVRTSASIDMRPKGLNKVEAQADKSINQDAKSVEILSR